MWERYSTREMQKLWSEETKYRYWLEVEEAIARAQGELGIIPKTFYKKLKKVTLDLKKITEYEELFQHDVIGFLKSIEVQLSEDSKYLHWGLTSYDIVDTALALRCLKAIDYLIEALKELNRVVKNLALRHKYTLMIGRTHGIYAQPITFGVKCLSWYSEISRNISRLEEVRNTLSYGKISGAVGCYHTVNPEVEARALKYLGLKPEPVSTQIVPRDRHAEFLAVLAILACGLERIATEIRNLQRSEIDELAEPFGKTQRGSSAMPHKRNPIVAERICSLARIIRSYAQVGFENIVQWHERDLTNSANERITIPMATSIVHYMIVKLIRILDGLVVKPDKMLKNLKETQELYLSQDLMLHLIKKGLPRDDAYQLTQELSFEAQNKKEPLSTVVMNNERINKLFTKNELAEYFSENKLKNNVDFIFSRILKTTRKEQK
ncbi:MAG: adenylosuccinate lyase [candidate division WOR-3 bacterium]|nr:adenylosuccinate lyase [candidate division WOR-3 bacterium]MDW7987569.1 adenylosuccinate lyase [candidate division WOR-3 bacterium]